MPVAFTPPKPEEGPDPFPDFDLDAIQAEAGATLARAEAPLGGDPEMAEWRAARDRVEAEVRAAGFPPLPTTRRRSWERKSEPDPVMARVLWEARCLGEAWKEAGLAESPRERRDREREAERAALPPRERDPERDGPSPAEGFGLVEPFAQPGEAWADLIPLPPPAEEPVFYLTDDDLAWITETPTP